MDIYNWYHSNVPDIQYIHEHRLQYIWRIPFAFLSPLADSLLLPFLPPSTYLLTWNPPSCDRIRPPRSQVACELTSTFPTLFPNPPPSKFPEPRSPSASLRRPQDNSGIFCPEHLQWNWKKTIGYVACSLALCWQTFLLFYPADWFTLKMVFFLTFITFPSFPLWKFSSFLHNFVN
jgi:hypothetical protein